MKNITFEGISTLQRLHLCWQIRKQIGKIHQPIKVEFHQPICRKQYSSLWYGGLVVSIKVRGCVFAIHACGDIYATLYDKSDGTELLYVKDKSNSGRFGVDVLPYLKTDHALYAAMGDTHKRYRLDMEHNNWWECFVYTPVGQLAIYAKHDKTDCAADYPGVFIDYVRKDGATAILACVEYDPNKEALQTVVYGNCASDEPTEIVEHYNTDFEE